MATAASTSKQLNDHTKDAIDDVESKAISGPRDNEGTHCAINKNG